MKYGGAGAALDGAKDVFRHANQVLSGLPLVQHAFWVILGAPMAQTICERGNSAARHLLGNWRNLGRIRLERAVVSNQGRPREVEEEVPAAAEEPAVFWQVWDEFAGMTLDASGAWVEANLDEDT